ncbi:MAG: hypothetical protein ACI4WW_07205 [Candidatus Coprovivens sp.]
MKSRKFILKRTKVALAYVTAGTYLLSMNIVGPAIRPDRFELKNSSISSSYDKDTMKKTLKPKKIVDNRYSTKIRNRI